MGCFDLNEGSRVSVYSQYFLICFLQKVCKILKYEFHKNVFNTFYKVLFKMIVLKNVKSFQKKSFDTKKLKKF
jgi:hypothetical protein